MIVALSGTIFTRRSLFNTIHTNIAICGIPAGGDVIYSMKILSLMINYLPCIPRLPTISRTISSPSSSLVR